MKYLLTVFVFYFFVSATAQHLPVFKTNRYGNSAIEGYYFLAANDNILILDKDANVVYYNSLRDQALFFTLEKEGKMLFDTPKYSCLLDSNFHVDDVFACQNNIRNDKHDALILPDNHLLLLGGEDIRIDKTKYQGWNKKGSKDTAVLNAAVIQELDEKHNLVFEWHAKDHFAISDADSFLLNNDAIQEWTHSNAIELDSDGNFLLSSRNLSEITKINRKDGSIMWRLGGKKNEFKFVNFSLPFYGQHNIRRLSNGHFTLFDNGQNVKTHGARALEFELDEKNKIATLVWSYTYDNNMSSVGRGNVQRLEDRNTLVNFGVRSGGDVCFVIVNTAGKKLFEVSCSVPNVYKVIQYSALPFRLHRSVINCFDSAGVKYLDAGPYQDSYYWNTGETSRIIPVKNGGTYVVYTPYGEGGYLSSEPIKIEDVLKSCSSNSYKNKKSFESKTKNKVGK